MIAALFVERGGVYFDLPDVDPWDEQRDARLYAGPHRVVAHPPCARWGKYWFGSPRHARRFTKGDDAGCFASALWIVRAFGGVLEHPAYSHAWKAFGLAAPIPGEQWSRADGFGSTCHVEQGHFGHRARKPTWLYAVNVQFATFPIGQSLPSVGRHHSAVEKMTKAERARTPIAFRDFLLELVRAAP